MTLSKKTFAATAISVAVLSAGYSGGGSVKVSAPTVTAPTVTVSTTTTVAFLPVSDDVWEAELLADAADRLPEPSPSRFSLRVERWRSLVDNYFVDVDSALKVMSCESGGNPDAKNASSTAAGLFQFLRGTWDWVAPKIGLGSYDSGAVFDPVANVRAAAWLSKGGTWWAHWQCKP